VFFSLMCFSLSFFSFIILWKLFGFLFLHFISNLLYYIFLRTSEIHLFYNLLLFYWHFLEILWMFIFLVLYFSGIILVFIGFIMDIIRFILFFFLGIGFLFSSFKSFFKDLQTLLTHYPDYYRYYILGFLLFNSSSGLLFFTFQS